MPLVLKTLPMKIKSGNMNIYDIWIDGEKNCHLISEMETSHINWCIKELRRGADAWRFDSFNKLDQSDKSEIHTPMRQAWFVVNAYSYLCRFREEMRERGEDTSQADSVIKYLDDAKITQ